MTTPVVPQGKRFRIETQEFPFQSFIDTVSSSKPIKELLKKQNIVFELRVRKPKSLCSKFFTKSKLLGRAEVGWMDVLHNNGSSMEKWISFVMAPRFSADEKPPALLVRMAARVAGETKKRPLERHECDCESCQWVGSEEDVFLAATAALDVVRGL
ncbi:hypothetical protein J5N97_017002 [Dioscorea zingiberensis]|uniref:Uncharacterized protein n=1 Tax=Dioscorea zingiberensis TaxID=325984 RepID=A0A9D5CL26_9LILI|nr:hypothetical protein J5N97_017002 [Dioscorea zingiberensis]